MKRITSILVSLTSLACLETASAANFRTMAVGNLRLVGNSVGTYDRRCEEDELTISQARGRFEWLKKCEPQALISYVRDLYREYEESDATMLQWLEEEFFFDRRGNPLARPLYHTLVDKNNENPHNYRAPTTASAACGGIPEGYQLMGATCRSSCYHPSQQLSYADGDIAIKTAFDQDESDILALADTATLDNMDFVISEVDRYTVSAYDTDHTLLNIQLASGGELLVTPNHPLVNGHGEMVEAKSLVPNESSLVTADGAKDLVVSIEEQPYYGKVYNVRTKSESLNGQILVAQGYLSGSDWYQNEGFDHLGRLILRQAVELD